MTSIAAEPSREGLRPEHKPSGNTHMYGIAVTDEELKRLEKRFGPDVRKMGPWNSDGVFGYSDVPILAIGKAAETLGDKNLDLALFRLESAAEPTKGFIEMLETFG